MRKTHIRFRLVNQEEEKQTNKKTEILNNNLSGKGRVHQVLARTHWNWSSHPCFYQHHWSSSCTPSRREIVRHKVERGHERVAKRGRERATKWGHERLANCQGIDVRWVKDMAIWVVRDGRGRWEGYARWARENRRWES